MPRRRLAAPRPPHVRTPREKLAGRIVCGRFTAELDDGRKKITGRAEPHGLRMVRVYLDDGRSGTGQVRRDGTIGLTIAGDFSD